MLYSLTENVSSYPLQLEQDKFIRTTYKNVHLTFAKTSLDNYNLLIRRKNQLNYTWYVRCGRGKLTDCVLNKLIVTFICQSCNTIPAFAYCNKVLYIFQGTKKEEFIIYFLKHICISLYVFLLPEKKHSRQFSLYLFIDYGCGLDLLSLFIEELGPWWWRCVSLPYRRNGKHHLAYNGKNCDGLHKWLAIWYYMFSVQL